MFFGEKRRIVGLLLAGCLLFTAEFEVFAADPKSEAQAMETINFEIEVETLATGLEQISVMASTAVDTQGWYGKALANTEFLWYNTLVIHSTRGKLRGKPRKECIS